MSIKPATGYFVVEEFEKDTTTIIERLKKEKRDLEKYKGDNSDNQKVIQMIESRLYSLGYIIKDAEQGNIYKSDH